jgi:CheY-like chemotaxis protein
MPQPPVAGQQDDAAQTPGRGRRVLIVDDNKLNRQLAVLCLQDAGFIVEVARSAEVALDMMATAAPDAVLSDVHMPGMDGFALRRAIKQDALLSRIPIVLVSAAEPHPYQPADADDACVPRSPDLREAIEALAAACEAVRG